eukprot:UN29420
MVATNASGTTTLRYGSMKQNVLGLEFISADGRLINTGSRARKTSAGYDLRGLMIGSEGTLGIVSKITIRLHPIPESVSAAVCSFDTIQNAVDYIAAASMCGIPLARMELVDDLTAKAL